MKTDQHLDTYLQQISSSDHRLEDALRQNSQRFIASQISNFTHMERTKGLLFGEVQSGKTAHMFGVIAATADADPGFGTFVLLTANNRNLHQQTIRRAFRQLPTFNICDESDDARFIHAGRDRPSLVILKKNPHVMRSWNSHFASATRVAHGPIFILDDEADNASQNTRVNEREISRTFELVQAMRQRGTSSIYLQVTATPQSLLLQRLNSETRPEFLHYFEPGLGYLGGSFFFTNPSSHTQRIVPESDRADLLGRSAPPSIGLKNALATFLVTCAQMDGLGETNANSLVHPSVGRGDHSLARRKVDEYLDQIRARGLSREDELIFYAAHQDLQNSNPTLTTLDNVKKFLVGSQPVNVYLLNSSEDAERENTFETGFNVIVGGNTLGRGITFSRLQTVYYVRSSKTPQADTFWQHSRMFGYDRIPELMRVFMPPSSFRAFQVFHEANENLVAQLRIGELDSVQILLAPGFRPTRLNVLDRMSYSMVVGGTNYFPPSPKQDNLQFTERMLEGFDGDTEGHVVDSQLIKKVLEATKTSESISWPVQSFIEAVDALLSDRPQVGCRVLVRRNRNITRDTGTLLSPDDRALGVKFEDEILLTLYRLNGKLEHGWDGSPFWVPNLKLPAGVVFHRGA